jgi:isopentenyl-diphosphate Delta-isomerase
MNEYVLLVNEQDQVIGKMGKLEAHEKGILHRAFSVFLFNSNNELLLQQRAASKYHCPLLWTNTCCSHPRENESNLEAANRRLSEEMGMSASLSHAFHFIYHAEFSNGLIEHELDHVFIGNSDVNPIINPEEVNDFKFVSCDWIINDMKAHPDDYTPWFKIALPLVIEKL